MEQSEKRLKTEIIDEDFIVPDHGRGYNVGNIKMEPIAGEDENDDPLSYNDCDIGPVKNQFFVTNEAINTLNEGINEMTQPQNKLTKGKRCTGYLGSKNCFPFRSLIIGQYGQFGLNCIVIMLTSNQRAIRAVKD
ncbi:uncharacterized protein LOC135439307 [Drosophila montana]|uniref:uncharacterized protein LOC135439307 n=1 Tax=Drosophila montana TaxID=40370 RepID=UPI00313C09A3